MSMSTLEARLQYLGGDNIGRINKQKVRSLQAALKNSYNKRTISTPNEGAWSCLLNSDNIDPNYDKKVLSVEWDSALEAGDVFEVLEDHTWWMVYLPDLIETAYLKAQVLRCRYTIEIDDEEYWVYFKGPSESDISWTSKDDIQYNELNLTGTLYITKNDATTNFFKRFTEIKIEDQTWRCAAVDNISVPGILEIALEEYYNNDIKDLPEVIKEDTQTTASIIGKTTVHQGDVVGYSISKDLMKDTLSWSVSGNDHVVIKDITDDGQICSVLVRDGAVKTFTVSYGTYSLTASIDITESVIKGQTEVYPYDVVTYTVVYPETYDEEGNPVVTPVGTCTFTVDSSYAIIKSQTTNSCTLEITASKKGSFTLTAVADSNTYTLPIKVKSF